MTSIEKVFQMEMSPWATDPQFGKGKLRTIYRKLCCSLLSWPRTSSAQENIHPSPKPSPTLPLRFRSYPFIQQIWLKRPLTYHHWTISLPGKRTVRSNLIGMGSGVTEGCHPSPNPSWLFQDHPCFFVPVPSHRHISTHQVTAWDFHTILHSYTCKERSSRSWIISVNYLVNVQWM